MNDKSQIVLEGVAFLIFQEVVLQRIKYYELSVPHSIQIAKKRWEKDMRKKGWFKKPFLVEGEEITEAHLEEYILKYVQDYYRFSFRGERTPNQIREYANDRIKYLKTYLVTSEAKVIMSLQIYNNWMNENYSDDFFFDCS